MDETISDEEKFPTYITATLSITYDVDMVIESIREDNRDINKDLVITMDDVMEYINNCIQDDFSCGWGHQPSNFKSIIVMDDSGEEY